MGSPKLYTDIAVPILYYTSMFYIFMERHNKIMETSERINVSGGPLNKYKAITVIALLSLLEVD